MDHEVITRRHLPHWFVPNAVHFVTYRLAGTIPLSMLQSWRSQRDREMKKRPGGDLGSKQAREQNHKRFFARYDQYLDTHRQIAHLQDPAVAAMIRGNLYHHDASKYRTICYCIMPNHVHVLLEPMEVRDAQVDSEYVPDERADGQSPLASVLHSLKSFTANRANSILGLSGQFWQHESYDHWVRDDEELAGIIEYIVQNPVKAGLVSVPHEWYFCSAHDRFLLDGSRVGALWHPDENLRSP